MQYLVFEWFSGGGLDDASATDAAPPALFHQGATMLLAVAEDFAAAGHQVRIPVDPRFRHAAPLNRAAGSTGMEVLPLPRPELATDPVEHLAGALLALTESLDGALIIAPESDGILFRLATRLEQAGVPLLGPDAAWIGMASDKHRLATSLRERGFERLPRGMPLNEFEHLSCGDQASWWPVVIKPFDGAGSDDLARVDSRDQLEQFCRQHQRAAADWRIEQWIEGVPVSIAAVGTGSGIAWLPPAGQQFDPPPLGRYVGADFPLAPDRARRTRQLAAQALAALPPFRGYVGLDLVLGSVECQDRLIEINPRLTMSFPSLRHRAGLNLAPLLCPVGR